MAKDTAQKTRTMLVAGKDGRIDTTGIKGQALSDTQAMALALQRFTDVLQVFGDEIGDLSAAIKNKQ